MKRLDAGTDSGGGADSLPQVASSNQPEQQPVLAGLLPSPSSMWLRVFEAGGQPVGSVVLRSSELRASSVNDSNHLRERAVEMRASSKELKDSNTAALIMRLADLYDRLADRAAARGDSAAHLNTQSRV